MPPFRFRLSTVQRLREAARDERRGQLAEALRIEARVQQQLDTLQREIQTMRTDRARDSEPGMVQVDRIMDRARYELVLTAEEQTLQRQVLVIGQEVQRRRDALMEADRDVRVLEKLKERQLERHEQEERRVESRTLDEIASWPREREVET